MSEFQRSDHTPGIVLVTGASGFLGSEIVRHLAASGITIRAGVRQSNADALAMKFTQLDVLDRSTLVQATEGVDIVIHAAGLAHVFRNSRDVNVRFRAINEIGTANVALAAAEAGVRHFVLVSSVSVYGSIAEGVNENAPCHPEGPYAESKLQSEHRAIQVAQSTGMRLTILRLATLYGDGDMGNVASLMRSIDRGRFVWIGRGSNAKSLLFKTDAARACNFVLRSPGSGVSIFNVSAPTCTMRQVVEGLASALGKRLPTWHVPASLALMLTGVPAGMVGGRGRLGRLDRTVRKWLAPASYDASRFELAFGFQTTIALEDGLRHEVAWYRDKR